VRLKNRKKPFLTDVLPLELRLTPDKEHLFAIGVNPKNLVEVPKRDAIPPGHQLSWV
jgi:hypothetical protein